VANDAHHTKGAAFCFFTFPDPCLHWESLLFFTPLPSLQLFSKTAGSQLLRVFLNQHQDPSQKSFADMAAVKPIFEERDFVLNEVHVDQQPCRAKQRCIQILTPCLLPI